MTSVKEIRQRLSVFLTDPEQEQEFRTWFALMLRDVHMSSEFGAEALAHEIMWAFHDQRRGLYTPGELMDELKRLATDSGVYFASDPFQVRSGTSNDLRQAAALVLEGSRLDVGFASVS